MSSQSGASHRDDGLESSVAGTITPSNNQTSHFRLNDLPPELRLIIHEFVLFSDFEERQAISKEALAHHFYYVSRGMQAEVELTYIKALDNYWYRVNGTADEALRKASSALQATEDHSEAMRRVEEAGNMTQEAWRKGRVVEDQLEAARRTATEEYFCMRKKGDRRLLEVQLQITKIKLAKARREEDDDEDAEAETREASESG
ncbi:hypothetical protein CBER1_03304 [Cercospora berteroae]|uniref:Uncharacterized protein n=1 Tax=Cercospora berteroae TaxID=357750 RepID=A0A2S6BQR6_9PEZI|nr:hypothetical protein CBER1_03304 [Cercospora berteroae]